MPPELVYLFSNKMYLFFVYAAMYWVVAKGYSYAAVLAVPLVYYHALYVHRLENLLGKP